MSQPACRLFVQTLRCWVTLPACFYTLPPIKIGVFFCCSFTLAITQDQLSHFRHSTKYIEFHLHQCSHKLDDVRGPTRPLHLRNWQIRLVRSIQKPDAVRQSYKATALLQIQYFQEKVLDFVSCVLCVPAYLWIAVLSLDREIALIVPLGAILMCCTTRLGFLVSCSTHIVWSALSIVTFVPTVRSR